MPLGVLSCFVRASDRTPRLFGWIILLGFLISLVVEITQAFIGRYSDLIDVLSNGLGFASGYAIAWWAVVRIKLQPELLLGWPSDRPNANHDTLLGIRFSYVVIALIAAMLPFNLTVSPGEILSQIHSSPPRLILDPRYHFLSDFEQGHLLILRLLVIFPFAALCALINRRRGVNQPLLVARNCLLFAVALELGKAFVLSAGSDVMLVILAPMIGFLVAKLVARTQPDQSLPLDASNWTTISLCYLTFIVLVAWSPYRFELSFAETLDKAKDINWVPLRLHFSVRTMSSALDLIKEVALYIPLGMFIAQSLKTRTAIAKPRRLLLTGFVCLPFALTIEFSQLIVAQRYVDITDPLLSTIGAGMGALLGPLVLSYRRTSVGTDG